jgi:hypothetical protein
MNNLSAAKGDSKGEINLQWDSVKNAVSYIIEIGNPNHSRSIKWKILDIISDPKYTVRNLRSNRDYFFRVAFVNPDGSKEQGREISKKAP